MQPGRQRQLVTGSILLGMFLAALEATAVAAAVPTAVGELGGVARYSWVFSAYLLTSTTTGPLFGKLADLIVLSKDIMTVPDAEIPTAVVDLTIVGGKVKYKR